ncbi:hypothetical protein A3K86_00265 [Photobacterium jeanii]|uniref:DUF2780 domain-containing protein n=1 Tax=Photobacterium jeanii TaxID=858640 RepID=A0A178KPK2_9GAMM|nr:DUF2780 domain-containing protein [Photobacterium jeanii]OAN19309.1 hypothetical protein A3K86_00265 [Photobacterium jeanii]PST86407.1 hypothetical protein C9I91_21500 [Photobacterium jeanii]
MTFFALRGRTFATILALFATLSLSPSSYAFSFSDLFGGGDEEAEASSALSNPLTDMLTSQLGVSNEQAAGGTGALLALAAKQLSGDQANELTSMIPGAEALTSSLPPGLSSMISNADSLNQVFSALGMDASMVSQFIPVIMQFMGDKGASAGLMDAVGKIWNPAS